MKPLFIFSLPRAGSTLLQKLLMAHNNIDSVAEPWILLPQSYMLEEFGINTVYNHRTAYVGITDFINNLPNKKQDYMKILGEFIQKLYTQASEKEDSIYFLDKTPRYFYIIPFIKELFPEAKFIFLFRNPVSIVASHINTWGDGKIKNMHVFEKDFINGSKNLSNGFKLIDKNSHKIIYEDLVKDPETILKPLFEYLELEWDMSIIDRYYNQNLKGKLGDPVGINKYKKITSESINKWGKTFDSRIRIKMLKEYIEKWDNEYFLYGNYDKQQILNNIENNIKVNINIFKDLPDYYISQSKKYIKNIISDMEMR